MENKLNEMFDDAKQYYKEHDQTKTLKTLIILENAFSNKYRNKQYIYEFNTIEPSFLAASIISLIHASSIPSNFIIS